MCLFAFICLFREAEKSWDVGMCVRVYLFISESSIDNFSRHMRIILRISSTHAHGRRKL